MRSFEEYIKQKLDDYEPEVPPHIWENIEARKKKRRAFFWFFFTERTGYISLSLLVLCLGLYRFAGNKALSIKDSRYNAATAALPVEKSIKSGITSSEKPWSTNPAIEPSNKTTIAQTTHSTSENQSAHISEVVSSQTSLKGSSANKKNIPYTKKDAGLPQKAKLTIAGLPSASSPTATLALPTSEKEASGGNQSDPAESNYTPNAKFKAKSTNLPNATSILSTENSSSEETVVSEAAASESVKSKGTTLTRINFSPQRLMNQAPALRILAPIRKNYSIPPCPGELPSANNRYVETYAGPDLVFTSYSDTSASDYINRRKSASEISFAYSAGARFTKVFGNGMSVKTGINFSHIIERFSILQGNIIQVIYILGPSGDTIGNYATRTSRYITNHNNYHTVDVPLLMGYEMNLGKWKANLNAGVMLNLYSWQNGLMIDTSGKVVSIKSGSGSRDYQFKTNMGLGFLGSLSLYYPIKDGMYFMAEPYFRYNLASANSEEISLRQKFHNTGVRFGLRFDLRKK